MMATLNRLFVWSWQHYTNKQSKPLFLYLWCENKQTTNKASGSYSLKCTSWTFKVAKQNSFLQKKKHKSQQNSFHSYKNVFTLSNISNYP